MGFEISKFRNLLDMQNIDYLWLIIYQSIQSNINSVAKVQFCLSYQDLGP